MGCCIRYHPVVVRVDGKCAGVNFTVGAPDTSSLCVNGSGVSVALSSEGIANISSESVSFGGTTGTPSESASTGASGAASTASAAASASASATSSVGIIKVSMCMVVGMAGALVALIF